MKTIILEEHFTSPGFASGPGGHLAETVMSDVSRRKAVMEQLSDIGEKRIAEMDAAGIDMQVLSLNYPGIEQMDASAAVSAAREVNDFLAYAVHKYPQRFAGFAALPTAVPDKAAQELERMVKQHGLKGAQICGHVKGRYLDDKFFWPIFECAEKFAVPIYLHPTRPPQQVIDTYFSRFSPAVTNALSGGGWGWHIETAVHVIRIIMGGVFDKYPKLQIIIGHLGEALPFMLERMDPILSPKTTGLKQSVGAYLRQNIHYTISGFNFVPAFLNLFLEVGVDRIMFSADYPHGSMVKARNFLDQMPVSPADKEKIAHGNAERLLKM